MKTYLINHKKQFAIVVLALILFGVWNSPTIRGHVAARYEVANDQYKVHSFGRSQPWDKDYDRLLTQRYNIQRRSFGCIAIKWVFPYTLAYDAVSRPAANRKFGRDVFAECQADARKVWEERMSARQQHRDR